MNTIVAGLLSISPIKSIVNVWMMYVMAIVPIKPGPGMPRSNMDEFSAISAFFIFGFCIFLNITLVILSYKKNQHQFIISDYHCWKSSHVIKLNMEYHL